MQNAFIEAIDALTAIEKVLRENNLYGQCRKQFDTVGNFVGDCASIGKVDASNGLIHHPRGRPRKNKIKEVENEDKDE